MVELRSDRREVMSEFISVKVLAEFGEEFAAEAVRLNKKQYGKDMSSVMETLANAGEGHDKFLEMVQVWVDYTAPRYFHQELDTYRIGVTKSSESTNHRLLEDIYRACIDKDDLLFDLEEKEIKLCKEFPYNATAKLIGLIKDHRDDESSRALMDWNIKYTDYSDAYDPTELKEAFEESFIIDYDKLYSMFEGGSDSVTQTQIEDLVNIAMRVDDTKVDRLLELKKKLPESFLQRRIMCCSLKALIRMVDQRADHILPHWKEFCKQIILQIKHPEWMKKVLDKHHLVVEDLKQGLRDGKPYGIELS